MPRPPLRLKGRRIHVAAPRRADHRLETSHGPVLRNRRRCDSPTCPTPREPTSPNRRAFRGGQVARTTIEPINLF